MKKLKLLALSGSLRKVSYNTAAILALRELAPNGVDIVLGEIKDLPLFNPDLENNYIREVEVFKKALECSSGLIIASPEYAHGISGPMKNALDWLVSGVEFPSKSIMLINTSPRAYFALDALKEVINTMSGRIVEGAQVSIPLLGSGLNAQGIVADPDLSKSLLTALHNFCSDIESL